LEPKAVLSVLPFDENKRAEENSLTINDFLILEEDFQRSLPFEAMGCTKRTAH
jgi:uncharacterized alpha-E superfamily protein